MIKNMSESTDLNGQLPPGWETRYDIRSRRQYYVDNYNRGTIWDDPRSRYRSFFQQSHQGSPSHSFRYGELTPMQHGSLEFRGYNTVYPSYSSYPPPPQPAFQLPPTPFSHLAPYSTLYQEMSTNSRPSPVLSRAFGTVMGANAFQHRSHHYMETSLLTNTDELVAKIGANFPTVSETHIRCLLKKYHNREAVVVSALQVEKHPIATPGPFSTPPLARSNHIPGNSTPFQMTPPISIRGTPSMSIRSSMMTPPLTIRGNIGTPPLGIRGSPPTRGSSPAPQPGSSAGSSYFSSPAFGDHKQSPRPQSSPKMKLRYLKSVFPKVEETVLLDTLVSENNNVMKTTEKLKSMGFEKKESAQSKTAKKKKEEEAAKLTVRTTLMKKEEPEIQKPTPPPRMKSLEEKNRMKKRLEGLYSEIPERLIQIAIESVNYDEEKARQLLMLLLNEEKENKGDSNINHIGVKGSDAADGATKGTKPDSNKEATKGKKDEHEKKAKPKKDVPKVSRGTSTTEDREFRSPYLQKVEGRNSDLRKGPNDQLLLADYMTWNGPNPELRAGPVKSLPEGPNKNLLSEKRFIAKGPNKENRKVTGWNVETHPSKAVAGVEMSDGKYSGLFSGRTLPQELGFRTYQGTDCGWSTCCRNSTHFHCRICGYGTSQAANVITHRRVCIPNPELPQKEFGRLTPSSDTNMIQHDVLQSTQPYSYYSTVGSAVSLPSHTPNPGSTSSKIITTQQSTMFNFVIPTQNSQYTTLYGTQTVFPNSNLFSPSAYNNFGQIDPTWLPQPRLIPPGVHSSNAATDLLGSGRNHLDSSSSPTCCGRIGSIETAAIGMCSPLTAEAYKVVSKEFQTKLDSQNWYCNSQSMMSFNGQPSSCKFSESVPSCSISLLLLEQNDLKQGEECINVDDLCFEPKNEIKPDLKEDRNQNFTCIEIPKKNIETIVTETNNEKKELGNLNLNDANVDLELESLSVSEESDIIVEESETETLDSSFMLTCLVCNKPPESGNHFVKISKEMPVTTTTQVSILTKLSQVIDDDNFSKLKNCSICPRCLNLINVVDQLEIKLKSAKKELVDIYKSKDVGDDLKKTKVLDSFEKIPQDKLTCQICDKQFSSINYLEKHKQFHTKAFSYYCEYCGKGFAILQKLENHLILHSNSSRFQCELCGKRFIQKHNLTDHLKKHKGEYKYHCTVCQKGFIRRSVYKTHLLIHNSESLMCQHCGKQFKNLANLSVHIKLCSGDLRFSCEKCDKKFPIKSLLKKHISIKHDSQYHFVCEVCRKGFGKKSDLKTHMRSHSDNKPFKCTKCNNSYKSLSNLNQHMKVHSTSKVMECNVCGKKFTRKDGLKDHMNQHTGNKPYKCTTCWKTFANRINFNSHMKRHNGTIKQTPCPVCGKLFSKGLKDHLTTHSGEKPYSCKHCLAVFTVKSSLNKHMKTKHDFSQINEIVN